MNWWFYSIDSGIWKNRSKNVRRFGLLLIFCFTTSHSQNITNANTIIKALWCQPLNRFGSTWSGIVSWYAHNKKELTRNLSYCTKCAYQFRRIHNFLSKLWVDPATNTLIYVTRKDFMRPTSLKLRRAGSDSVSGIYPADVYFKSMLRNADYPLFYALYFDAVARLFVVGVHEACETGMHPEKAEQYLSELSMIHQKLMRTQYEERYARQLRRYHSLLALMRKHG